jgi:hypothetical protein
MRPMKLLKWLFGAEERRYTKIYLERLIFD